MGFFAAGGDVVGRAIIRDLYRGRSMQQLLARVYLIQAISPIVGPILGAQITEFAGWKLVLLAFGLLILLLLLAVAWFLSESLPVAERRSSTPKEIAGGFKKVLSDRTYLGLLIYGAVQLGALYAYLNFAPFIYRTSYQLSASEIGLWLAVIGAAGYAGVQVGSFLAQYIKGQWLLLFTAGFGALCGAALFLNDGGSFWITQLAFSVQMFIFGVGLTNVSTIALYNHGTEAGTATSLMGVANFAFTTLISAFFFLVDSGGSAGVGAIIMVLFVLSFLSALLISRPWLIPDLRKPESS
jgi:DHA1 family bicyclomycin/chloramphenicol resistance-like MFS transporter